LSCKQTSG